ncbi:CHAT domain-containing protein [Pseudomonas alliivorans]|nr:CHAT domain-containing protein [Pseudomonas alliivorans]MEE5128658.1 CHAT domain-containing protein [Pseudomonas alliivorans]
MTESNMQQPESVLGYDPRELFAKGFKLGSVDLIQGGSFSEVIGRTLIALLIGVRGENGKSPFSGITVILPPASTTSLDCESVFDALILGSEALRGTGPTAQELDHLKRTIQILNCPTLDTADLEATVLKSGARRLVAIASASIYRDMQIDSPGAFGASAVLSSEDLWVPHVASLCRLCVAAVKGSNGYAVIHVEESPAVRPNNIEQLCATDDCYVAGLSYDRDEKEEVDQQGHRWLALAFGGEIAKAVAEIEGLQLSEVNRYHVLAQLFSRAAMHDEAIAAITQLLPHIANLEYSNLVQLAWLAHKSGNDSLALHFLPDNAERLSSVMWIEQGLELATIWKNNDLIKVYDDRLAEVHPASAHLRENRDRRLLWNCSATTEAEQAFTTSGFTKNHLGVLSAVTAQEPDYDRIIEQAREWGVDWLELAAICCAMHAWSSGDSRYAADIACQITTSDLYGRQATQVLLWSVRSMMLREQIVRAEQDYYRAPLQAAIRFLAVHPEDESIRSQLSRMLSVDTCGDIGIPMMATTMLDIAEDGVEISKPDEKTQLDEAEESHSTPNEEEIKAAIESGLAWLGTHGAAEFGVTVLPVGLVSHPDETLRYLARMILMSAPKGEDVDLRFLELLAMLACAISPHAKGERNEDLRVMRLVAANCATSGQFQRARNLAEQLLVIGQGSPLRRRLAWLGFADVYHRCRNMAEALVGLACAFATNAPINKADLWQEVHTSVRVLRDLGLIAIARGFLPALKALAGDLGLDPENDPRIVATEMSLRLMEVKDDQNDEIEAIVSGLARGCERAMHNRSLLLPLILLLGQAVQKAHAATLDVNEHITQLLKTGLEHLGEQASLLVETVSTGRPSASDVVAMFNQVQRALYSADAVGDLEFVGVVARRLFNDGEQGPAPAEDKALAVELLADHAIAFPSPPPTMENDWPVRYATSLNKVGIDVVFLGIDSAGELVVTHVSNGDVQPVAQPRHESSFRVRMEAWLKDYPRQYGYVESADGDDEFFITMEQLDLRLPATESLLVVAEPLLQQMTINLGLVTPEDGVFSYFLGSRTAVGMTPSLTWLSIVRSAQRSGNTRYKAWISPAEGSEANGTLGRALERLGGTFEAFGFEVDTGRNLPPEMSDAKLAVITAHGGLTAEGRFIHSISDEDSLIETPTALAAALAGIEVVILFVCSGGRIDKHPWGNTTVGLPKMLLEKGCRVVIASPWPLDVKVTYNWLEPFMRKWDTGATILQATTEANAEVARRLGDHPQYSLGMTAYGDILLTK